MTGLADKPHAIPTGDRPPYPSLPPVLSPGVWFPLGDGTSGETGGLSSGALACSCRLPAGALSGVFSPRRLFVTLDRQPEPEVLMASSALSIKEDILAALKDILMRHLPAPEIRPSPIDGLVLVRREDPPAPDRCFERPLVSVIVQGSKRSLIGSQEFVFRRGQFLVSGIDMPSSSSFFDTAPGQPFLSLFFYLDRQILTDLMLRMRPAGKAPQEDGPGVAVADAEPEFLEAVLRLAELLDKPEQIAIRAPMILQELHYLLLIGPLGHVLRGLYAQGSQNSQVLQAVSILRRDLGAPVRMESLARQVGMSLSTLHRHFKTVTGLSPLQYLKQLRLHEAQRLMLMEDMRAASAALSVGYESVTQFSREYKRMFGEPPHRDIQRKRTLAPLGEAGAGGL